MAGLGGSTGAGKADVDVLLGAVQRHDDKASPSHPNTRVGAPRGEEEWDTFIMRYSVGELADCDFSATPDRAFHDPSSEAGPSRPLPAPLQNDEGNSSLTRGSTTVHAISSTSTPAATVPPSRQDSGILSRTSTMKDDFVHTRESSPAPGTPSTQPELSGSSSERDVRSRSGPANQDPDIPNISSDEQMGPSTRIRHIRPEHERPLGQKGEGAGMMTRDNMRQLAEDIKDAQDAEDRQEDAKMGTRGSVRDRRRRRARDEMSQVALGSVGRGGGSAESSPESDDEGTRKRAGKKSGSSSAGASRKRPVPRPRSRGSWISRRSKDGLDGNGLDDDVADRRSSFNQALLETGTNTSTSVSHVSSTYDFAAERARVRDFFDANGYLSAPRQPPEAMRRRLRVIRRLGLEQPDKLHNETFDRFTRLASSIFKTPSALVSIITKDRQVFLSEKGFGCESTDTDVAFCTHTTLGEADGCFVVHDAAKDWRFRKNPLVDEGRGPIQFYAGAPLRVGKGSKVAVIGSLCVVDNKPREFSKAEESLLEDLAESVVSELELLYSQQATVDTAKLHQISVDFLRRTLRHRPRERAGVLRQSTTTGATSTVSSGSAGRNSKDSSRKRKEGADAHTSEDEVDIYDEACREIRVALDAYAVAVVDLSQFHLFYPAYQSSSMAGTSTRGGTSSGLRSSSVGAGAHGYGGTSSSNLQSSFAASSLGTDGGGAEEPEAYAKSANPKRARQTYALTDPTATSRTPQVLFIPSRTRSNRGAMATMMEEPETEGTEHRDDLAVLGYSCERDGFAFNFTSSPAARKTISDFIASNVKTRKVWYTRDDSEGIAQSISHLMPPGTETSMAMPVFGFDGQVAFAIVACWTDPLYTYPAGAMQFVETIAGSLLASVMKERLHQAERAQINFAAAASHELRTPLHQINAAAALLRSALSESLASPRNSVGSLESSSSPTRSNRQLADASITGRTFSGEERTETLTQLEIIEANGIALGNILENIIDTLDIGKMATRLANSAETKRSAEMSTQVRRVSDTARLSDLGKVLEEVVNETLDLEARSRRVNGAKGLEDVEVILELSPRHRGGWLMTDDPGPLARALGKIVHNACKFTDKGYVHIQVQDVSRDVVLPAGFSNSIKMSTVSIDIKDSGRGMTGEFLDQQILRPFAKADPFMPGSGLGLGLAQRMIEIFGGKLAIASTPGKGTLVHVEIPLHLLSEDSESDLEKIEDQAPNDDGTGGSEVSRVPVRQDGIYLLGFESRDIGLRRMGKSLVRQLKLHFCRIVSEIQYASLIVARDEGLDRDRLATLVRSARPGAQVIVLAKDPRMTKKFSLLLGKRGGTSPEDMSSPSSDDDRLQGVQVSRMTRPLRPSLVATIMKPVEMPMGEPEKYVSPVVGGGGGGESSTAPVSIDAVISAAEANAPAGQPGHQRSLSSNTPTARGGGTISPRTLRTPEATSRPTLASSTSYTSHSRSPTEESALELLPSPPSSSHDSSASLSQMAHLSISSGPGDASQKTHHAPDTPHHHHPHRQKAAVPVIPLPPREGDTSRLGPGGDDLLSPSSMLARDPLGELVDSSGGEDGDISESAPEAGESGTDGAVGTPLGVDTLQPRAASPEPGVLRVLVVEDNAVNRKILTTMLRRVRTCRFAEAVDGVEAVTQFSAFRPDLILLDMNMPRKDGFQASAEIRGIERREKSARRCRIVAVTALSSEAARRRGMAECGVDEWKTKPVGIRELKAEVEKMLERVEGGGGAADGQGVGAGVQKGS